MKLLVIFFNLLLLLSSFLSFSQESDVVAPTEISTTKKWSNSFHQTISNNVFRSAQWFDSFFLEEGDEQISPKTSARIKLGWEPKARDFSDIGARFKLKIRLPHLKDKIDLIFSDTTEDQFDDLPLTSIQENQNLEEENFSAAIRYILKDKENVINDARFGVSGGDLFFRARHKRTYNWGEKHSLKIEPALFYFLGDGFGSRLLLEYNFQINPKSQFRIDYSVRGSQAFNGVRWQQGIYILNQLSEKQATVLGFEIKGEHNDARGFAVDEYNINYRYRFNALEKWLFFEIEPFLEFTEEDNFKLTPGIGLRVEGFFHKKNQ